MTVMLPAVRCSWRGILVLALIIALSPCAVPARAQISCSVQSTPYFTEYYGDVWLDGIAAPIGAVVEAFNGQGVQTGCFVVTIPGVYGYMRVYGADAATGTPGMAANETVTFRVNGAPAAGSPSPVQWTGDKGQHEVDLSAQALPAAVDDVGGVVDENGDIYLTWSDVGSSADHYEVWRGVSPYFLPEVGQGERIAENVARPAEVGGPVWFTDTASHVGNPDINDFYVVVAVSAGGVKSLASNRVGAFDYRIVPGQ